MKITHRPYVKTRVGKTVPISELEDGDIFIIVGGKWAGKDKRCFLYKGDRYNLDLSEWRSYFDYRTHWKQKCEDNPTRFATIVDSSPYLEKIEYIKGKR